MHLLVDNSIVMIKSAMKIGVKDIPFLGIQYTCAEDTVKIAGKAASNYTGIAIYSSWYDKGSAMEEMRRTKSQDIRNSQFYSFDVSKFLQPIDYSSLCGIDCYYGYTLILSG